MKTKMRKVGIIALLTAMIMTLVTTVSAETVGEGITVGGVNLGWVIVIVGIVVAGLAYWDVLSKKLIVGGIILIVVGAIFLVPYETTTIVTTTDDDCCDFEFSGAVIHAGAHDITSVWDEDDQSWTIPLTVADSSDGNLTGHCASLNITFDPIGSGKTANDICTVHFESDYLMKYGGEYIVSEDSTNYMAIWTTEDGTEYIDDSLDITADSSDWARINFTFNNGTAGNWVTELDAVGDGKTFYITMSNDCASWTETITVKLIVVSYTA